MNTSYFQRRSTGAGSVKSKQQRQQRFVSGASSLKRDDWESVVTGSTGGSSSFLEADNNHGIGSGSFRSLDDTSLELRSKSSSREFRTSKVVLSSKERRSLKKNNNKTVQALTVNKLRFSAISSLQGRDDEKALLKQCLEQQRQKQIVWVGGHSGVGKTALANCLRDAVEKRGGAFCTGKLDYGNRDQPFAGIVAACSEICGKILSMGPEKVEAIQQELVEQLGDELPLLASAMPALEEVVGSLSGVGTNLEQETGQQQAHENLEALSQKLKNAFQRFVRIICGHFEPLVILLDDLQLATQDLDLMEVLMTDRHNERLLILGCYRSNEVDETHVMSKTRRDLQAKSDRQADANFVMHEILLGNLSLDNVNQVIMALLSMDDPTATEELAKICFNRTQGNCLFLLAFVMMLEREGLLEFNLGTFKWMWDVQRIEEETASTGNVVELLVEKMNQLPDDLRQLLLVSACLGSKFEETVLCLVWAKITSCDDVGIVKQLLEQAVQQNFLESSGPSSYRWVHDKIKEAALTLVPEAQLSSLQFDIGTTLARGLDPSVLESMIFVVVSLLDTASHNLDEAKNIEIAELSAKAATKAKELSAFESAAKFAAIGIKRLPQDDKWARHYRLSHQLFCTATESEGILANTDTMQAYADEVLANARSLQDKLKVTFVVVDRMAHDGRLAAANELALDTLKQLKVSLPRNGVVQAFNAISGLFSMKKTLATVETEKLPLMQDQDKVASMKLLEYVATFSYLLKAKVLLLNAIIKMLQLTVAFGVSPTAPSAFATFGMLVAGVLKDYKTGSNYAEMAISMVRRLKAKSAEPRVMFRTYAFALSYTKPLHDTLKPLLHGYKLGIQAGETEGAAYCMLGHATSSFLQSVPLKTIQEDCQIYIPHMRDLGRFEIAQSMSYIHEATLYLMGLVDSCDLFSELQGEPKPFELSRLVYKSALYAFLGEYELGADHALAIGDDYLKKAPGAITCQGECFTRSICLYVMARRTNKRKYKKHAQSTRKTIQSWVEAGNMNSNHQLCLLDAEDAALCGKKEAVVSKLYEKAIVTAARTGFLREAGLANERYADFLLHVVGDKDAAKYRVQESIRYYQDWGAQRVVEVLETKYADLVGIPATTIICMPPTMLEDDD